MQINEDQHKFQINKNKVKSKNKNINGNKCRLITILSKNKLPKMSITISILQCIYVNKK